MKVAWRVAALALVTTALLRCSSFDEGASSAVDAGGDAAVDASDAAVDAADAAADRPAPVDASFSCATPHFACLSFDDGRTPDVLFETSAGAVIDDDASSLPPSPPGSLVATATPGNGAMAQLTFTDDVAVIRTSVAHRREAYDALVAGYALLVAAQGPGGGVLCGVSMSATSGQFGVVFSPPDGGAQVTEDVPPRTDLALPKGVWGRLEIDLFLQDATPRCNLSLDGVSKASVGVPAVIAPTRWSVAIGISQAMFSGDGGAVTRFDDFVIDVER